MKWCSAYRKTPSGVQWRLKEGLFNKFSPLSAMIPEALLRSDVTTFENIYRVTESLERRQKAREVWGREPWHAPGSL